MLIMPLLLVAQLVLLEQALCQDFPRPVPALRGHVPEHMAGLLLLVPPRETQLQSTELVELGLLPTLIMRLPIPVRLVLLDPVLFLPFHQSVPVVLGLVPA